MHLALEMAQSAMVLFTGVVAIMTASQVKGGQEWDKVHLLEIKLVFRFTVLGSHLH